jgi:hypothetical protein
MLKLAIFIGSIRQAGASTIAVGLRFGRSLDQSLKQRAIVDLDEEWAKRTEAGMAWTLLLPNPESSDNCTA